MTQQPVPTIPELQDLAITSGWSKGVTRYGRTFYTSTTGKREWLDVERQVCSAGFWFLFNVKR